MTDRIEYLIELCKRSSSVKSNNQLKGKTLVSRYSGGSFTESLIPKEAKAGLAILEEKFCGNRPACKVCPARFHCEYSINNIEPSNGPTFADFFCGAGGMTVGFERAGYKSVFALDNDPWSIFTYKWNRPIKNTQHHAVVCDIRSWLNSPSYNKAVDVVAGGVPCQPFSNANRQRSSKDNRWNLFKDFVSSAVMLKPKIILIENVAGFSKVAPECMTHLKWCGYTPYSITLNASQYGTPQNRIRTFIISVSEKYYQNPSALIQKFLLTLNSKSSVAPTLWDAIGDLPVLKASIIPNKTTLENKQVGYAYRIHDISSASKYVKEINGYSKAVGLFNHKSRFNNSRDIEIFKRLAPGEDSRADSIKDIMPYTRRSKIFHDKYYRLRANKICRTITAHMRFDCNSYIHPSQARGLTAREAARVQGFPDNYVFAGTFQRLYQQIGNAVPPLLAEAIASSFLEIL